MLALEGTRAGIWDTDLGSGTTWISDRFGEIMGYLPGKCPASPAAFIRHVIPEHRKRVLSVMRQSVVDGQPYVIDCRIIDANGEKKWLHVRGNILVSQKRAIRIVGTVVDITPEVIIRLQREEQDRFLAGINAALPMVVYVFDLGNKNLRFTNHSVRSILGYADESSNDNNMSWTNLLHPEDAIRLSEHKQRISILADGEADSFMLRARHSDGSWRWLRSRNTPLRRDPEGEVWQILGTVEDLTELVSANELLKERERELARAQEIAGTGSWTWIPDSQSFTYSQEFARILGLNTCSQTKEILRRIEACLPEQERSELLSAYAECISKGTPVDMRCSLLCSESTTRHVHVLAERMNSGDTNSYSVVGTIQDISALVIQDSERAQLEAKVHHAQKLESLGLLAGGIAHDFNNLLVGVLSNASLALLDLDESSPAREVVLEIERAAQRAADLTRQLLAYSGKGRFVVEPIELGMLASEMAKLLKTVTSRDAVLTLHKDEGIPLILGDATQIRQVIMNLITNASDALEGKPGEIAIRTLRSNAQLTKEKPLLQFGDLSDSTDSVILEISDTGTGMTREIAERIFDPFFSTRLAGRGLGLAAALGIVRSHSGRISVFSSPGEGTRIRLAFPVADISQLPDTNQSSDEQYTRDGKVLIVDDDRLVRNVATALLSRHGFTVETVEGGPEALQRLSMPDANFVFILLDMTMPGMSGSEVLEKIRSSSELGEVSQTPVFLMSGYSEQDVRNGIDPTSISGFLQKPFTLNSINQLLRNIDAA